MEAVPEVTLLSTLFSVWGYLVIVAVVGIIISAILALYLMETPEPMTPAWTVFLWSILLAIAGPFGAAFLSFLLMRILWQRHNAL